MSIIVKSICNSHFSLENVKKDMGTEMEDILIRNSHLTTQTTQNWGAIVLCFSY